MGKLSKAAFFETEPAMPTGEAELNIREQITRIDRAIAETAKFAAEQRKLEAKERQCDRNRSSSSG
jgi:hypothetical protein